MNEAAREQKKLLATFFGNLSVATFVAGFIAPGVAGQMDTAGRFRAGVVWSMIAIGFYMIGHVVLGGLR